MCSGRRGVINLKPQWWTHHLLGTSPQVRVRKHLCTLACLEIPGRVQFLIDIFEAYRLVSRQFHQRVKASLLANTVSCCFLVAIGAISGVVEQGKTFVTAGIAVLPLHNS